MKSGIIGALRGRDASFWIEWISTAVLITGVLLTSLNVYPLNLVFNFAGNLGWFVIGFLWRKYSLIVVQTVILAIYFGGLASNANRLFELSVAANATRSRSSGLNRTSHLHGWSMPMTYDPNLPPSSSPPRPPARPGPPHRAFAKHGAGWMIGLLILALW